MMTTPITKKTLLPLVSNSSNARLDQIFHILFILFIESSEPPQLTTTQYLTSLNDTELIPLIPIVIEQIRFGRVTDEELVILKQIFGNEFWQLIENEVHRDPANVSADELSATLSEILKRYSKPVDDKGTKRIKRSPTVLSLRRLRLNRQRALLAAQRRLLEEERRNIRRNNFDYYNYYL